MKKEGFIVIYVPESLIPELTQHCGPVLFYLDALSVDDGFALAEDEFVTSVRRYSETCALAGIKINDIDILSEQD
ncbi:hypothetical protein M976_02866 [Buttiauxella ferragutiae ATCC 51602]|uniref:Uncharacterized protein n=1 Tax=Buttiauxella ferragutiae ATCC 51602 TaxID=1354252 RepID=A0ABX2W780_9ENTR|nr:hypothetical protein [Buttiauxella ferragutiae]OAT26705.1 hypothetical protein M976_02866 [Buttiauxella ferragutiae ATCC 51602]